MLLQVMRNVDHRIIDIERLCSIEGRAWHYAGASTLALRWNGRLTIRDTWWIVVQLKI